MRSKTTPKRKAQSFYISEQERAAIVALLKKLREKEVKHGNAKY